MSRAAEKEKRKEERLERLKRLVNKKEEVGRKNEKETSRGRIHNIISWGTNYSLILREISALIYNLCN